MRLKGDKIYPDYLLKIPDLDFYSPRNVEHAYQLADMLYARGYKEARAINAQHMETMRVDLADNHFIADITYRPTAIFESLPYLTYNGMRLIHPDFQRLDIHSSLAFPYDNVPREVIFERWDKDIKRFNKLNALYPIISSENPTLRNIKINIKAKKHLLTGFLAYAVLYDYFAKLVEKNNITDLVHVIKSSFSVSGNEIIFSTLDTRAEFAHYNPSKLAEELSVANVKYYEPYINLLVNRASGNDSAGNNIIIYSTHERLIAYNSIAIGENIFRITNVQYLLKHFLAMYFINNKSPQHAQIYLAHYLSLINMIAIYENFLVLRTYTMQEKEDAAKLSPLYLSVQTYGNDNINLARKIALNQMNHELHDEPLYKVPRNYYPARNIARGITTHPPFNPADVVFFREEGRELSA